MIAVVWLCTGISLDKDLALFYSTRENMYNITSNLVWICPTISLFCLIILITINVYKFIRRKFSVKVNCWFCNQWTKVPYDNQNSFECPTCLQYNGFNLDGGYNRVLSAQYDERLNKNVETTQGNGTTAAYNGLCRICNNNQQLRVFQLANFVPLSEANYDVEIEHFAKQLDKAYKLCDQCEKILKKIIQKQNIIYNIKLSDLGKKGMSYLDLNTSTDGVSSKTKRSVLKNILFYTIVMFAVLNVVHLSTQLETDFNKIIPDEIALFGRNFKNVYFSFTDRCSTIWYKFFRNIDVTRQMEVVQSYVLTLLDNDVLKEAYLLLEMLFKESLDFIYFLVSLLPIKLHSDSSVLLYSVGSLLQCIWLFVNSASRKKNTFLFLMWLGLLYLENDDFELIDDYTQVLKIGSAFVIILSMFWRNRSKRIKMQRKHIRASSPENDSNASLGSISDDEDVNISKDDKVKVQPVFNYNSSQYNSFCDNPTANKKSFCTLRKKPSKSIDLDLSLNELHIGTRATKSIFKPSVVNGTRSRPVLSPAKLLNLPSTWTKNSSNFKGCPNFTETNRTPSPNPVFDGTRCQTVCPNSMINLTSNGSVYDKQFGWYCSRFQYTNGLHCNTSFQPLLNNEQLVYLAPNFVQSSSVYELYPSHHDAYLTNDNDKCLNAFGDT
ncbi:hypothetical protein FQR65_LT14333 [Abscondita terminalis]|nr:hypothetical protein FQR65_LT14333 [Abscondita terminalis]